MTPLAASSDCRDLLAAICAQPDDDTVRLVAADELEAIGRTVECPAGCDNGKHRHKTVLGNGAAIQTTTKVDCRTCSGAGRVPDATTARATFIRVQCELARMPAYQHLKIENGLAEVVSEQCKEAYHLRARESALLLTHEADWRRGERCGRCEGNGQEQVACTADLVEYLQRTGKKLLPFKQWQTCGECHGIGWIGPLAAGRDVRDGTGWVWRYPATFERGFVAEVHCSLADAIGPDDKPTAWAVRLVRTEPVQRVVLSDRPAYLSRFGSAGSATGQLWYTDRPDSNDGHREPWKSLSFVNGYHGRATAADATRALATATATLVRRAAGYE